MVCALHHFAQHWNLVSKQIAAFGEAQAGWQCKERKCAVYLGRHDE
jgi:hypothetical protein